MIVFMVLILISRYQCDVPMKHGIAETKQAFQQIVAFSVVALIRLVVTRWQSSKSVCIKCTRRRKRFIEPLLKDSSDRFVLYPITDHEVSRCTKCYLTFRN